jgi:4-amino-4-deoxy-L-arabinose transferase-like glycosyltransferase
LVIEISLGSVLVGAVAFAVGISLSRRAVDGRFAALTFLGAFLLRAGCAIVILWAQVQSRGTGALFQDDYTNDLVAGWLLRIGSGEPVSVFPGHAHLLEDPYVYLLTLLYLVLGHDLYGAKLLSALFGSLMVPLIYDLTAQIGTQRASRLAAVMVAVFPSLVLWTSLALQEGLILLLSLALLRALVEGTDLRRPLSPARVAWLGTPAVLLALLRPQAVLAPLALAPLVCLVRVLGRQRWPRSPLVASALVTLVLVGDLGIFLASPASQAYLGTRELSEIPQAVHLRRTLLGERGRTSLLSEDERDYDTAETRRAGFRDLARFLAEGTLHVLVAPLPWTSQSGSERFLVLETLAWYALLASALVGGIRLGRARPHSLLVLVGFLVPTMVVMALFDTNLGTLVRHRAQLYPGVFILASIGLEPLFGASPWVARRDQRREKTAAGGSAPAVADPSTNA